MAIQTWNETIFPLPSVSYNADVDHSNIRTNMDSGRARQRPRFSREIRLASAVFELNRLQYAAWNKFWNEKLNRGTDWFNMRLPLPDTNKLTETEIRFASDYKEQHRHGGNWDVSVTIEIKEVPTISDEFFELLTIEGSDLTNWLNVISNLHDEIEHWEDEHSFNLAS
jgi:hypothetical protein